MGAGGDGFAGASSNPPVSSKSAPAQPSPAIRSPAALIVVSMVVPLTIAVPPLLIVDRQGAAGNVLIAARVDQRSNVEAVGRDDLEAAAVNRGAANDAAALHHLRAGEDGGAARRAEDVLLAAVDRGATGEAAALNHLRAARIYVRGPLAVEEKRSVNAACGDDLKAATYYYFAIIRVNPKRTFVRR